MKHPSAYLNWYISVPHVKHDLRSSGITHLNFNMNLGTIDLSINYAHGNPETAELLARRYHTRAENVFISSEGATGQNTRIIRLLAERKPKKNEAIVEYPTYEPLLRQVQDHFRRVKRLERKEKDGYRLDADTLKKLISERTSILVLTNPHAPSGATAEKRELEEIMSVAKEHDFFVLCDEIYAEFNRKHAPAIFSIDPEHGIVTTSFTKAYGLGGLKLGIALARKELVDELYTDVLNTVGNSPNIVQLAASKLLATGMNMLEEHKQKWLPLKAETEKWLEEQNLKYFPRIAGVTYWVKLPIKDTFNWINKHAIPRFNVAPVPGAFFLFKKDYEMQTSNMVRLGLGSINPDRHRLSETLDALEKAVGSGKSNF
ncbi:MAG: pyridoxal phosphate-dependent aminotransferase [Candidatus Bathyarchaeota archaeon]|nr:pyridoxal phosphate-dependent aminotransferase [Candidatus Bathyarchaeota archaeon]